MDEDRFQLLSAPIIEAVLDIDSDMPPGFDLAAFETKSRELFRDKYPTFRKQVVQEHRLETKPGSSPTTSSRLATQALQFLQPDGKQLVQVRAQGFSFNRLAPYTTLDDYLSEFERTWRLFVSIAAPLQIRCVRLRYINRILLPTVAGKVSLDEYLRVGPRLPGGSQLTLTGFLDQHTAIENDTGNQVVTILTSQSVENETLPLILDIIVNANGPAEVDDWPWIRSKIQALRALKNTVFRNTLTERCLNLFQQH